jgi:23S rRNA pseudouridine1911/1915/1917 synthase
VRQSNARINRKKYLRLNTKNKKIVEKHPCLCYNLWYRQGFSFIFLKECAVLNVIYKDKNIIAVEKVVGMPVQADLSEDKDLLSTTSETLKSSGEYPELWLVHRLDRVVGGVVVFARNKRAAAALSALIQENKVQKHYYAIVEGITEQSESLENLLYKDSSKGKAFVVQKERRGVKKAVLNYRKIGEALIEKGVVTLIDVDLITGRFHQIRAQMSYRQNPLLGDGKYGSKENKCTTALYSYRIKFNLFNKEYDIKSLPDTSVYPWNLFEADIK